LDKISLNKKTEIPSRSGEEEEDRDGIQFIRSSLRQKSESSSVGRLSSRPVYEEKCIFCERNTKYQKNQRTREPLRQAHELRVDDTLRVVATEKSDSKILAITSRDIVAAEARYHNSCYKKYTRINPVKEKIHLAYQDAEKAARNQLFQFIRTELFSSPSVIPLVLLYEKIKNAMKDAGIAEISEATRNNLKYHLQHQFGDSCAFLPRMVRFMSCQII